jgi:hypothetical protein
VLPEASVAVAVTTWPAASVVGKVKDALPLRLVLTVLWPRKVSPSPKPVGMFATGLEKNWTVKLLLKRLLSVAVIWVVLAEVMMGKFCRRLGPPSGSHPPNGLDLQPFWRDWGRREIEVEWHLSGAATPDPAFTPPRRVLR